MLWPLHAEHGPLAIDDSSCNNLDSLHVVVVVRRPAQHRWLATTCQEAISDVQVSDVQVSVQRSGLGSAFRSRFTYYGSFSKAPIMRIHGVGGTFFSGWSVTNG